MNKYLAVVVLMAFSASAQAGQALHDIPWYQTHTAARGATIKLCRSDHSYAHDTDCLNAETAEDRVYAQDASRTRGQTPAQIILSPSYWANNRLGRGGALASCHKYPGLVYPADVCAAAQQGETLDMGRR